MSEPSADTVATPDSAPPRVASTRAVDVLWTAGLMLAVAALLGGSLGGAGAPARMLGIAAFGLGVVAGVLALKANQKRPLGPVLTVATGAFAAIVGGHPTEPRTILLADAPTYKLVRGVPTQDDEPSNGTWRGHVPSDTVEVMSHPGPLGLFLADLLALPAGPLAQGTLVAAEWDGGWFAGRIVSVSGATTRVHFVGWESEWDEDIPRDRLRGLSEQQLPKTPPAQPLGVLATTEPTPCALSVAVYQPDADIAAGADLGTLTPSATLYAERLDVSNAAIATALPGQHPGRPFALRVAGAVRFEDAGPYYFGLASDGRSELSIDGAAVTPGQPVPLTSGLHDLTLDYRHDAGLNMTLGLRLGKDPKALRPLDTERQGVAQVAHDKDGSLRLVLPEDVLFDFDKDQLNPSANRALETVFTSSLAPAPRAYVRVEGHTDDQGSDAYNLDLSRRRAERVKTWLSARGRDETTLSAEGFGEKRPRVPNDSEANRHKNRRVELVISSAAPPPSSAPRIANPTPASGASANQPVIDLLDRYYADLNAGTFDAARYFEPNVERYITMMNTTTGAMNHYIRDIFPKQFHEPHFALEQGSLVQESPGQYVYVEQSHYILAGKTAASDKRYRVRIRLSPGGKIVFLHQFEKAR